MKKQQFIRISHFLALQDGIYESVFQCFVSLKPWSTFIFHMAEENT